MPNEDLRVPVFCPICEGIMKGKSTNSYYDFGCCIECKIWFLEDRPAKIQAWKDGWRPTPEEVQQRREAFRS